MLDSYFRDNKKRVDIMFDIESLALSTDATIVQLSAVAFDIKSKKVLEEFNMFIDINSVKELVWSNDTIAFWLKNERSKFLFNQMISKGKVQESVVIRSFHTFLKKYVRDYGQDNVFLWANGMLFDTAVIENKFKLINESNPILYKNKLDLRTLVKTVVMLKGIQETSLVGRAMTENKKTYNKGTIHNALDDCYFQICLLKQCLIELNKSW